ncbi:MAG: 16S rRNA processing protein RimM [Oscillospiraceae bacterium]|nr:16S rRNA processing protein RimM [Oscillospiraceae bacterium]
MNYIETGEIISLHGIRGEVKVYPWADYPEFLEEFDTFYIKKNKMHYQRLTATSVRTHKNVVLIEFEGIDNTELARNLIGKVLYLDRDEIELEEGFYFVADLIGCKVINHETDREIGTVTDVKNLGASDIYYIQGTDGKDYMFPAVEEFLMGTDIENRTIRVKVIEGMFSED